MKKNNKLIKLIKLPKKEDACFLCFMQYPHLIPFPIKRVYFILNPKPGLPRGCHAHYKTDQILFCIQGSVKMVLDNGFVREEIFLNSPEVGIILEKKIWHEMHGFKKNTILLVVASRIYEEKDYIRNYSHFLETVKVDLND